MPTNLTVHSLISSTGDEYAPSFAPDRGMAGARGGAAQPTAGDVSRPTDGFVGTNKHVIQLPPSPSARCEAKVTESSKGILLRIEFTLILVGREVLENRCRHRSYPATGRGDEPNWSYHVARLDCCGG